VQCDFKRDERAHAAPHEGQPDLVLLLQPLTRAYEGLRHLIAIVLSEGILSDRQEASNCQASYPEVNGVLYVRRSYQL
jgi:hypothetical protein